MAKSAAMFSAPLRVPTSYVPSKLLRRSQARLPALVSFGFLFALSAVADAPAIEWRGTLQEKGAATFALLDPTTGVSKWVSLGGNFESYSVNQYDKAKQVLVLLGNGNRLELSLTTATLLPVPPMEDGLRNLSGMALADALANRGDVELKERLSAHRHAVLALQETGRQLASEERVQRTRERVGAENPAMSRVATEGEATVIKLRAEARHQDAEIERMANEISSLAVQKRAALPMR